MCTGRLRQRVPSAEPISVAKLANHSLRFHKRSLDGSGKCDAYFTGEPEHVVWGVVFDIDPAEECRLDDAEGLGRGYSKTAVMVETIDTGSKRAVMYIAKDTHVDPKLKPYSWYKRFVVEGARLHCLPAEYIATIEAITAIEEPSIRRNAHNRVVNC